MVGWTLRSVGYELSERDPAKLKPVVIYGAASAGVALVEALWKSGQYRPVGFVDQSNSLWGQYVAGFRVSRPDQLGGLLQKEQAEEILIALPEADRRERAELLRQLQAFPVRVKMLPALEDIASGRVTVNDLRPVSGDDLLGRRAVPPDPSLLARDTRGKNVLVTGAGGTIGSELVRQILRQSPRRLFMLDASETALYEIDSFVQGQLAAINAHERPPGQHAVEAFPILASIEDASALRTLFDSQDIHTVYHAAAYKHVPIVEHNVVIGLRNNTFGTAALVEQAKRAGVGRLVLISTDKAVRPTSVMGASKRLGRNDPAGPCGGWFIANCADDGTFRKRPRQLWLGGPEVSQADRSWWSGHGYASAHGALFHVDTGSRFAGHSGGGDGKGWRGFRPRNGRASAH